MFSRQISTFSTLYNPFKRVVCGLFVCESFPRLKEGPNPSALYSPTPELTMNKTMKYFEFQKNPPESLPSPVLFMTGEASFLRESTAESLEEIYDLERISFDEHPDRDTVRSRMNTKSLFQANRTLFHLRDTDGQFLNEHGDWLVKQAEKNTTMNPLLLEVPSPDNRKSSVKSLKQKAFHIECEEPDEEKVKEWIDIYFQRRGCDITPGAKSELIRRKNANLRAIRQALEKVSLFAADDDQVTERTIHECVEDESEIGFYDFTDAWLDGEIQTVLQEVRQQIEKGDPEQKISGGLLWAFRRLRFIIELDKIGYSTEQIQEETGLQKWIIDRFLRSHRSIDPEQLKQVAESFLKKDLLVRTGQLKPDEALELLILTGLSEVEADYTHS